MTDKSKGIIKGRQMGMTGLTYHALTGEPLPSDAEVVTDDFAEFDSRTIAALGVDPDRANVNWIGMVLPGVEKDHVNTMLSPLNGTGRYEIHVITGKPDAWTPDFHTVSGSDSVAMVASAGLPPELDTMPYGSERIAAVKNWHKRLHGACYAEIICKYPQIYVPLMREIVKYLNIKPGRYPVLWSNEFVRLFDERGTLGGIEIDGLIEMGYITVPREWL